ncbi:RHS repeat domain-containing protein [Streptomyces sp. NPDC048425]|uniref:RHS repeat domain-containing protein n=1 Tax=Streptomyces sp. NPDC048425 TaxID=3365548 RepID=UPI003715517D
MSGARDVPLRFTYDDENRVTSWTDRNGHTYGYVYDTAGRVVMTEGPTARCPRASSTTPRPARPVSRTRPAR